MLQILPILVIIATQSWAADIEHVKENIRSVFDTTLIGSEWVLDNTMLKSLCDTSKDPIQFGRLKDPGSGAKIFITEDLSEQKDCAYIYGRCDTHGRIVMGDYAALQKAGVEIGTYGFHDGNTYSEFNQENAHKVNFSELL